MKKIFSIIIVLLSVCLQGFAQQYINLYQDDVVIKQYSTEEIDSMSVSETEPRIVSFWRDGDVFQTYNAADIDSIKVTNRGGAPLSYIGIVGFNNQLQTKDIGILSPATASQYMSFVSNLPKRDGTILYYAFDNSLDMLEDAHIESPLKSVNVITFTDGLDQGSLMMTDKYSSTAAYLDALGERIAQAKDSELSPNFIALGLRGSDVSDMSQFRQNLQRLASSADNVFEVSSISDLRAKFQDIANQIISVSTRQSMSVRVIGVETGTRMRFVFDGNSAATSELYIEGTFDLQDRSLHDVTYHGIKATSGKTLQGTQDGIFVTYTFTGMRLEAGTSLIPTSSVKHYYMSPSSTSWQANSEFTPTGNTQRNVSHSGTLIFLVLDCSSSLGSDFSRMQQYANEFIDLIASNAEPYERLLPPTNVKAELDENDLVVNVSWDAVKYAQSYNVYRSSSSSGTYSLVAEGVTSTTWTDRTPKKGYNNYYKVCAKNWNEASSQSSYASVEVRLAAPTNVKAELEVKDEKFVVNVFWNAVKYAESYNVFRSSSSSGTYSLVAKGVTSTTWKDESPQEGYNYYEVRAVGYGTTSSQSSYSYVNVSLAAPTNVKAEIDENDLVVNVSWDAVKYAQSYKVYRRSSTNGTYELVAEGITSTTWIDDSPQKGYNDYVVCAEGYGFTSSQSSYSYVTVSLAYPSNVKAEIDENDLVVNVSWNAVKYAQSYKVYRSSSSNGTYELVAEGVTSTTWTDSSPLSGSNYYKVCAVNRKITTSQSLSSYVIVSFSAPTNVKAEIGENDLVVNVSWDAVKYAQSYKVYRSSSSSGTYSLVAEGVTSTTWTDSSPLSGSNYYKVCAVNRKITSAQSSYTSVTVNLAAPKNVKAELEFKDEKFVVNVSWTAVKYAESYKVYRSSSSGGTYSLVAEGVTSTTWTDSSPLSGSNYYEVCAVNRKITSVQSSYSYVNVSLAYPTNVKAVIDENDLVVNVSWDAVKNAESYNVYRCSSPSGTYSLIAEGVTSTSWTDNNPMNGNNYYKVKALNKDIISAFSNAVRAFDSNAVSIITVNGVAFNMVKVSGGTFQMGATSEQGSDAYSDEEPVHQVTLSDYYIGETEVTQELWQTVMGSNPSDFTGSSQLPVEKVSWDDCQTFITKLNALTGMQFRLPTEAEWEFAARGGNSSQGYKYSGSNNIDDVAWYKSNSNYKTHEVGTKAPNELGLYDMSGNVDEWCQDWYGSYSSSAQTNPMGPTSGQFRVSRGGSWNESARICRVSLRGTRMPYSRFNYLGLRLAL